MQANNFPVYLYAFKKKGVPALEMRKLTTNPEVIKLILEAAFTNRPLVIFPIFRDRIRAANILQKTGIIKFNTDKQCYEYLI